MSKPCLFKRRTLPVFLTLCMTLSTMTACTWPFGKTESDFVETGVFGISVTDRNGVEVNPWFDSTSNTYYLFLTNACSIPEVELDVTGIRMAKTSNGTLDTDTNTVTGAFAASGDAITLTDNSGTAYNVVVKQSGIPSLSISLNGTTLNTINTEPEGTTFDGESVLLTDESGNVNVSQSDVEIKGRGNTTWAYSDKKPYQLKFSEKQSVLGMAEAKKWVLLASAFDDSMLRNKTAYYLGDQIGMAYSPDLEFVDVWVDGEYRGTYSIGEKCEIDENRVNLTDSQGALMEYDNFFYEDEDYWFEDPTTTDHFAMDEWVDDSQADAALSNFESKETAFTSYLYNTDPSTITLAALEQYIDVDSVAKWYLVNEYLSNVESFSTSWLWYCNGASDVLHMGPLWDFDTSQGIPLDYTDSDLMFGMTVNTLINRLFQIPEFTAYVEQVFSQYRSEFSSLTGMVAEWGSQLTAAADCNYTRWQWLGGENDKGKSFATTYEGALSDLENWLTARDSGFNLSEAPSETTSDASSSGNSVVVSEDGRTMIITASNVTETSSLSADVWSGSNDQDDLQRYPLTANPDGTMGVTIDLTQHGSSDTYYIDLYDGDTLIEEQSIDVTMTSENE